MALESGKMGSDAYRTIYVFIDDIGAAHEPRYILAIAGNMQTISVGFDTVAQLEEAVEMLVLDLQTALKNVQWEE